jgi:hypothetical protein
MSRASASVISARPSLSMNGASNFRVQGMAQRSRFVGIARPYCLQLCASGLVRAFRPMTIYEKLAGWPGRLSKPASLIRLTITARVGGIAPKKTSMSR